MIVNIVCERKKHFFHIEYYTNLDYLVINNFPQNIRIAISLHVIK